MTKKNEIIAETVTREFVECVKPASMEYKPTGKKTVRTVEDENGNLREEKQDIMRQVMIEAEYKTREIAVEVFAVYDDAGDRHEFATREEARKFKKGK